MVSSFFELSPALLRRNLKRFWTLSLIAMIVGTIIVIATSIDESTLLSLGESKAGIHYISALIDRFIVAGIIFSLIISLNLANYLFSPNSVTYLHSLPLTRGKIYYTNFISGLILTLTPIVLSLMLANYQAQIISIEFWSLAITRTVLTICFYYTLFNIAWLLCSDTGAGILLCIFLIYIPTRLVWCFNGLGNSMLFGYIQPSWFESISSFLSLAFLKYDISMAQMGKLMGIYILIVLLFYSVGAILYAKRSLEVTGRGIVFKTAEMIVISIITSVILLLPFVNQNPIQHAVTVWLLLAIVVFLIANLILRRTFNIFSINLVSHFFITLIVVQIVIFCFKNDVLGYQKYLPDAGNVDNVMVTISLKTRGDNQLEGKEEFILSDLANIEKIHNIHSKIIADVDSLRLLSRRVKRWQGDFQFEHFKVNFEYRLKNGNIFRREYAIEIPKGENYLSLFINFADNAGQFSKKENSHILNMDDIQNIVIGPLCLAQYGAPHLAYQYKCMDGGCSEDNLPFSNSCSIPDNEKDEFLQALKKDLNNTSLTTTCDVALVIHHGVNNRYSLDTTMICGSESNIIKFANDKGYYTRLNRQAVYGGTRGVHPDSK